MVLAEAEVSSGFLTILILSDSPPPLSEVDGGGGRGDVFSSAVFLFLVEEDGCLGVALLDCPPEGAGVEGAGGLAGVVVFALAAGGTASPTNALTRRGALDLRETGTGRGTGTSGTTPYCLPQA